MKGPIFPKEKKFIRMVHKNTQQGLWKQTFLDPCLGICISDNVLLGCEIVTLMFRGLCPSFLTNRKASSIATEEKMVSLVFSHGKQNYN